MNGDYTLEEMGQFLEREKIRDCIARLARAEDRRCDQRIRMCFWSNAKTDFGIFSGTFLEYLDWVAPGSQEILLTQHILGQTLIYVSDDQAGAETHVTTYHRVNTGKDVIDVVIGGRYLDRLEKRDREWRIIDRTMLFDWVQNWGPSMDLSQGLMGKPFSDDHFIGRTFDDFSEKFFQDFYTEEQRMRDQKAHS